MNRAELQDRIRRHIATAVAAITTDVAEYTAGQVKAAVVPPAVVQRGEPAFVEGCPACMETAAFATAYGTGAAPDSQTRNTTTPPHNTGR